MHVADVVTDGASGQWVERQLSTLGLIDEAAWARVQEEFRLDLLVATDVGIVEVSGVGPHGEGRGTLMLSLRVTPWPLMKGFSLVVSGPADQIDLTEWALAIATPTVEDRTARELDAKRAPVLRARIEFGHACARHAWRLAKP